jgi:hypothetical protein
MATFIAIVVLGFLLGMRHATDPDHVVAMTTIVSRERTTFHAMVVGAFWGLGHTITIFVVGSAIILFKLTITPRMGLTMELSVGFMLILLGVLTLTGLSRRGIEWITARQASHGKHSHFVAGHWMIHAHDDEGEASLVKLEPVQGETPKWWKKLEHFHILRPLIVGIVHGLVGSAAVALLVLAAITRPPWAVAYLLVFGLGTIAGMMLITAMISLPFTYTLKHSARLNQALGVASGVLSLSFGLFLCYQTGIVGGLFTSHPNWTPH